jgi:hypothetical protein
MRKIGLALIGAAALAGSSAASAVEFVGDTQGCFSLTSAACTPVSSTANFFGLTFSTGHFDQLTSASGFAGIGSGNSDTLGFVSQDGSANNYAGDYFTLLVNFTAPAGVTGGGTFQAMLTGDVSGSNNGGAHFHFNPSTQIFNLPGGGTFTLGVDDFTAGGGNPSTRITGYIQTAPVPEPATWALMLVGFAGVGMAMRRRRTPALAQLA